MELTRIYQTVNGDLTETLSRLGSEKLLVRLLEKFRSDSSLERLEEALEHRDLPAAFLAVHTLKGVALNLGFTELAGISSDLTEQLRPYGLCGSFADQTPLSEKKREEIEALAGQVRHSYLKVINALQ